MPDRDLDLPLDFPEERDFDELDRERDELEREEPEREREEPEFEAADEPDSDVLSGEEPFEWSLPPPLADSS